MTKLQAAIMLAEVIRDVSALDCNVLICDSNLKVLHYAQARTFLLPLEVGSIMSAAGFIKDCVDTRRVVKRTIPASVYGVPFKGIVYPIIEDDGTLSGVLGTSTSLDSQVVLQNAIASILARTQEMTAMAEELGVTASQLSVDLMDVKQGNEQIMTKLNKSGDILKFVNDVAANSNLLGLNAAIEAARAGEQGRGFAVVADEIRKMAINSAQAVEDIRKILQSIKDETVLVANRMSTTAELGNRQAVATEKIENTIQHLSSIVVEIEEIAQII